jgi:DNA-binding NarL/FixJ family response regulator
MDDMPQLLPPIVIVDRWSTARIGLRSVLCEWWKCAVLEVADLQELSALRGTALSLLIIGTDPITTGLDHVVQRLRRSFPAVPLVLWCSEAQDIHLEMARRLGLNGCLFRTSDLRTIRAVVSVALTGDCHYPRCPPGKSHDLSVLGPRELVVLRWVMHGLRNKEIADRLCLSEKTVSAHKQRALRKLGITSAWHLRPSVEPLAQVMPHATARRPSSR